jgi:hypothetical protein
MNAVSTLIHLVIKHINLEVVLILTSLLYHETFHEGL